MHWTSHAKGRTYDRRSHPKVAQVVLETVLQKINRQIPRFLDEVDGDVTLRSFEDLAYFVCSVYGKRKEVCVVTYGDVTEIYPKAGDMVATIDPKGVVSYRVWESPTTS